MELRQIELTHKGEAPKSRGMDNRLSGLAGLNERSREIFRSIVDAFIESGEPVGSRTVSKSLPHSLSPASVRNVMADLEDAGLIEAPHTSAGRVPTELGLRFFVDALLETGPLGTSDQRQIDEHLKTAGRDQTIENVLADATNLLSGLSHCAGVVVTPTSDMPIRHLEFMKLSNGKVLAVLVAADGSVENRALDLPADFPVSSLIEATNYLNARFAGKTLSQIQQAISLELQTIKSELDELTARVVENGIAVWSGTAGSEPKNLIVRGQANLIGNATAAKDLERIRLLFDDIENKKDLIELLAHAESGKGMRIFIGSENKLFSLSGSSVIISPYHDARDKVVGVLGVIGPTRLNYARIIPMVDYTARIISRLVS